MGSEKESRSLLDGDSEDDGDFELSTREVDEEIPDEDTQGLLGNDDGGLLKGKGEESDEDVELHPDRVREIKRDVARRVLRERRDRESVSLTGMASGPGLEGEAAIVITILKPVCITMLIVIFVVMSVTVQISVQPVYFVYNEQASDSVGSKFLGSLLNALIFVFMIVVMTGFFVLLYYYRCLKLIFGWLIFSTGVMFAMFGAVLLDLLLDHWNAPMDWITFSILCWNFTIGGLLAIFWYAPPIFNKAYLIFVSALMAVFFTRLPPFSTWMILFMVAVYDLFAVLCPGGPLKVLVELAQERNEPIPALLYNSSLTSATMADGGDTGSMVVDGVRERRREGNPENAEEAAEADDGSDESDIEDGLRLEVESELDKEDAEHHSRSVKLGLGDFVFYSVLVGRAAMYDIVTVFTCFVGIVAGLFATLVLLALFKKALPALPISIGLAIFLFLTTRVFILPFVMELGVNGVIV